MKVCLVFYVWISFSCYYKYISVMNFELQKLLFHIINDVFLSKMIILIRNATFLYWNHSQFYERGPFHYENQPDFWSKWGFWRKNNHFRSKILIFCLRKSQKMYFKLENGRFLRKILTFYDIYVKITRKVTPKPRHFLVILFFDVWWLMYAYGKYDLSEYVSLDKIGINETRFYWFMINCYPLWLIYHLSLIIARLWRLHYHHANRKSFLLCKLNKINANKTYYKHYKKHYSS